MTLPQPARAEKITSTRHRVCAHHQQRHRECRGLFTNFIPETKGIPPILDMKESRYRAKNVPCPPLPFTSIVSRFVSYRITTNGRDKGCIGDNTGTGSECMEKTAADHRRPCPVTRAFCIAIIDPGPTGIIYKSRSTTCAAATKQTYALKIWGGYSNTAYFR
jgi:hypothetical protein